MHDSIQSDHSGWRLYQFHLVNLDGRLFRISTVGVNASKDTACSSLLVPELLLLLDQVFSLHVSRLDDSLLLEHKIPLGEGCKFTVILLVQCANNCIRSFSLTHADNGCWIVTYLIV